MTRLIPLLILLFGFAVGCAGDERLADGPHDTAGVTDAMNTDVALQDTVEADDSGDEAGVGPIAIEPDTNGPWSVSYRVVDVQVADRTLPVGVWGPSHTTPSATTLDALVAPDRVDTLRDLLADAPSGCVTDSLPIALDAELADGSWPVVVYSHCHMCLGISGATVAHRLASWGFVVLAPDHVGNTLYDELAGDSIDSFAAFLPVRAADVIGVLDALEAGADSLRTVRDHVDPGQIATVGHSFGAVTAAYVAQQDDRVSATVAMFAPIDNPLIPGVDAAGFDTPLLLLLAGEDNSILEVGNLFVRQNFEATVGPTRLVEWADAGHWSVSDLCGLTDLFMPGCGDGVRQTNGEAFTYPDPMRVRSHAAAWTTAMLGAELRSDDNARAWLSSPTAFDGQAVQTRNVE